jgi:hypothetical protein
MAFGLIWSKLTAKTMQLHGFIDGRFSTWHAQSSSLLKVEIHGAYRIICLRNRHHRCIEFEMPLLAMFTEIHMSTRCSYMYNWCGRFGRTTFIIKLKVICVTK